KGIKCGMSPKVVEASLKRLNCVIRKSKKQPIKVSPSRKSKIPDVILSLSGAGGFQYLPKRKPGSDNEIVHLIQTGQFNSGEKCMQKLNKQTYTEDTLRFGKSYSFQGMFFYGIADDGSIGFNQMSIDYLRKIGRYTKQVRSDLRKKGYGGSALTRMLRKELSDKFYNFKSSVIPISDTHIGCGTDFNDKVTNIDNVRAAVNYVVSEYDDYKDATWVLNGDMIHGNLITETSGNVTVPPFCDLDRAAAEIRLRKDVSKLKKERMISELYKKTTDSVPHNDIGEQQMMFKELVSENLIYPAIRQSKRVSDAGGFGKKIIVVDGNHVNKSDRKKTMHEANLLKATFPTECVEHVVTVGGTDYGAGFVDNVDGEGLKVFCSHRPKSAGNPVIGNLDLITSIGKDVDLSITSCKHIPGIGLANDILAIATSGHQNIYPYVYQIGGDDSINCVFRTYLNPGVDNKGNYFVKMMPLHTPEIVRKYADIEK
ncbi:MAG: hypothetical protein KAJ47_04060, partial [Candidatus Aenigmarchaeota archaeon]|nr:hypothetical protein [Candidatus Aenigmarchaeota archaeon]